MGHDYVEEDSVEMEHMTINEGSAIYMTGGRRLLYT